MVAAGNRVAAAISRAITRRSAEPTAILIAGAQCGSVVAREALRRRADGGDETARAAVARIYAAMHCRVGG